MEHTRTLSSVLSEKLADSLQSWTLGQIARMVLLFFVAGFLSAVAFDVERTGDLLEAAMTWHQYAIPKTAFIFAAVLNARRLWSASRELFADWSVVTAETIEGIPAAELLDHLFTFRSFKRDDIEAKFRVPRYRVVALTKKLKEIGVLTHGENNLSILNEDFSRQDVASILEGKTEARQLQPLFRKDGSGFTSRPSAQEIRERVAPLLQARGFTSRVLASDSCTSDEQPQCYQAVPARAAA